MLNQKALTGLLALTLAGSLAVPAAAADAEPTDLLTRGELLTMLYEQEGKPAVNYAMDYSDVDGTRDDAEAIRWAADTGIAGGYGDGRFGPDDPVTREQAAVILYRYAQSHDQGFTGAWAFRLPYTDAADIGEYAYEAVCWVTMEQVLGDTGDGTFAPDATVPQAAGEQMMEQFLTCVEF